MPASPPFRVRGTRQTGYVPTVQSDGGITWGPPTGTIGNNAITPNNLKTGGTDGYVPVKSGTSWLWVSPATAADISAAVATEATARAAADTAHAALTTTAHGGIVASTDARLSDARTPTDGSVTAAKIAPALKPSGSAATTDEALRALGTTAGTAAAGNDSRLSDSRTPTGSAGGELSGTYPNPGIAANLKQAKRRKLALAAQGITGDAVGDASIYLTGTSPGTQVEVGRLLGACDGDVITYVIVKFISITGLSLTNAYVAVYDGVVSSATQLGVSADIKASIATGLVRFALATPVTKSGDGAIYCTVKQEGATLATVARSGAAVGENGVGSGVASSVSRTGIVGAPATGANFSTNANGWYMAWA